MSFFQNRMRHTYASIYMIRYTKMTWEMMTYTHTMSFYICFYMSGLEIVLKRGAYTYHAIWERREIYIHAINPERHMLLQYAFMPKKTLHAMPQRIKMHKKFSFDWKRSAHLIRIACYAAVILNMHMLSNVEREIYLSPPACCCSAYILVVVCHSCFYIPILQTEFCLHSTTHTCLYKQQAHSHCLVSSELFEDRCHGWIYIYVPTTALYFYSCCYLRLENQKERKSLKNVRVVEWFCLR